MVLSRLDAGLGRGFKLSLRDEACCEAHFCKKAVIPDDTRQGEKNRRMAYTATGWQEVLPIARNDG